MISLMLSLDGGGAVSSGSITWFVRGSFLRKSMWMSTRLPHTLLFRSNMSFSIFLFFQTPIPVKNYITIEVQSLLYWIFGTRIVLYVNDIAMIRLFYRENRDNTGLFLRFSSCQPFLQGFCYELDFDARIIQLFFKKQGFNATYVLCRVISVIEDVPYRIQLIQGNF
uniref:Uncharacterized protein n=1 Tax=Lactuca sativa TaxID=4236 RepID=A0A9R1W306_LACSA|nr:hypothetical protein LSAT_V11C300112770 [Lactuca sativa]